MFQSLLGFLMRCDLIMAVILSCTPLFQSLLGFLMRCDDIRHYPNNRRYLGVSIPAGFSDALRLVLLLAYVCSLYVSIPAGFSDALRRVFFVAHRPYTSVSIPAGFSDALRHYASKSKIASTKGFNPCWVF